MSGAVDYVKVVDLLTDTIKELNQPCVEAPAAPAERTAEERKQIMADVLRGLVHELEGGGAAGAAAEHGASAETNGTFVRPGRAGVSFSGASGLGAGASSATPKTAPAAQQAPAQERPLPHGVTKGFCGKCFMDQPFVLSRAGFADTTGARDGRCSVCGTPMKK